MKKTHLILIITIFFYSCSSTDDNASIECLQNCTVIEGKILSSENLSGIANAEIIFYFKKTGLFSSNERIIGRSFTDNSGNFTLEGLINDNELGASSEGSFIIDLVDNSLSEEYFKSKETIVLEQGLSPTQFIDNKLRINEISSRDTIINYEIVVPKKEIINVYVTNFNPISNIGFLQISSRIPSGIPSSIWNSQSGYTINKDFEQEDFVLELIGGKNLINTVIIYKRKNNIDSQEVIELNLSSTQNINIEY